MQGDVAKHLLVMHVPGLSFIGWASGAKDEPLALGPKIGLHGGMPLLPVKTGTILLRALDIVVIPVGKSMESASECDNGQVKMEIHLAPVKALCLQLYSRLGYNRCTWLPDCAWWLWCGCAGAQLGAHCPPQRQAN